MTSPPPDLPESRRLVALDGVRGIAAIVVLLHHVTLFSPERAALFLPGAAPPEPGSWVWWFTSTPLAAVVIGGEAVFVFFLLSGLVLTLPALDRGFDWLAYYPRRMLRLLLPVAAAVVLAIGLALVLPQDVEAPSEIAAGQLFLDLNVRSALTAVELFTGTTVVNNPLWSLRYELIFSVLLPVAVVVVLALRRWWLLGLAGTFGLLIWSWIAPNPVWRHLPMFLLGAFLAVALPTLRAWAGRIRWSVPTHLLWGLGLGIAVVALTARWVLWPITQGTPFVTSIPGIVSLAGAVMLLVIVLLWPPASRLLGRGPFRWLGRISFSLYIVHMPVIMAAVALLPGQPWWVPALVGVPCALLVAEVFTRVVEAPSHRFARWAGRASRRIVDRSGNPTTAPDGA